MAENRAAKWLKQCDTEEKGALKRSRTQDEEEEEAEVQFPATEKQHLQQQQPPAGPDLEEDLGVGLSLTGEGNSSSNFDVFISHRGPDTKHTLAYHMYDLLQAKGIRAFLDKEELQSGEWLSEAIEEAIKCSKVHVCILSSGYAESVWCLKELEMMIHKYEMGESKLIPVFYDVEPWEVRHLKGAFEQGFQNLVDKERYSRETTDKWRRSLSKIAEISGVKGKGERCNTIVRMICKLLFDVGSVATSRKVVGIQEQLCWVKDEIMKRRKEGLGVTSVEISGIGGIGKTTFARELYNMICRQYQRSCFIEDVNGLVEKHGVNEVHSQLIRKLFSFDPSDFKMEGKKLLSARLKDTEFLVVLDNIHSKLPLSYVFIEDDVLASKESLIIVTSREKGVLQQDRRVAGYYQNLIPLQISELRFPISKQIFCEYAFGGIANVRDVKNEFNELINNIVRKCHGVPLALILLGNVVRGKDIKFWRNLWNTMKDSLFQDVKKILKLSYENLETELEKCLFLDVATFFRWEKEEMLVQLRSHDDEDSESEVFCSLEILERKLLIHKNLDGSLNMHDLLVDLGKSIIKDEDPLCPGGRSRVWHPRDVRSVLSEEKGTEKIKALSLVSNNSAVMNEDGYAWSAEAFSKMPSLEFLILDGRCIEGNDFSKLSKTLLWLKWTNFPYDHIPETLCIKRMRVLQLSGERLTWLWERTPQETPAKLRELSLSKCKNLQRLPEFNEKFLHLSCLNLDDCTSLVTLPNSFGRLHGLKYLRLDCNALKRLPDTFGNLRNLSTLQMFSERLKSLPESFGRLHGLTYLQLECNALKRLPDTFGNLRNLSTLQMFSERLKSLPESFGNLWKLQTLKMSGCGALQHLAESFGNLWQLQSLEMRGCGALQHLPESFGNLSQLQSLKILGCGTLQHLPESFGNLWQLQSLEMHGCGALQHLQESFGNLSQLQSLKMLGCGTLQHLPESFGSLSQLQSLKMLGCGALQHLPESFGSLSQLQSLEMLGCGALQHLPESFGNLSQLQSLKMPGCGALQHLPESFGNLVQLTNLEFDNCMVLECLPKSFGNLSLIAYLWILDLGVLQCLPESFGNLSGLQMLSINKCIALQCLPESFGKLLRLEFLVLNECNALQCLPESFGNLPRIKGLSINQCIALQCLPESFGKLLQLEWLTINKCSALQQLSMSFGNLSQLKRLEICNCSGLQRFPETFECLTNLLKLRIISCTGIEGLPESFGYLPQLQHLDIKYCSGLKGLPESFGHLPQLRYLKIEDCSGLEGLPKSFGCWTKLVKLKVNHCHKLKLLAEQFQRLLQIDELSIMEIAYSSFGQNAAVEQQNIDCWKNSRWHGQDTQDQHLISLVHKVSRGTQAYSEHAAPPPFNDVELIANQFLQELPHSQHIKTLHLRHCHSLQKLPDTIGSLSRLTELDLNSCLNLKMLPACIENLSRLKELSLISCWNLKELPDTIGNLKNLEKLYISDCIVLKGFSFQSGSFSNLISFTVEHCWLVEVIDIHALVRLEGFVIASCINLRSIAGLSGLPKLEQIRIQGCLNLKDIVPGDITGCASLSSLKSLEISGCYQLRPPPEGLVQQLPHKLEKLHLSLNHDIISRASLDNRTETMPRVQGFQSSRVVNAKTSPALFPVVEQRVTHLLSTKHDSCSSSTSAFSFHKFSQGRATSSSFPLGNGNIKYEVGILCFVTVVGTVDSPMHVPPPQTIFRLKVQNGIDVVQSASFDFGEAIHMATFRHGPMFDLKHMYSEVQKGTDYWPNYGAIVKEGWMILLPGREGKKKNKQNELLVAEIFNIFYSELIKQRFMARAWTQLPSQLSIFEFSALDIAGCQITKASRHCNTCIMEEETGLTWKRRRCLFVDDHALLLQHPRSSSKHSFLAYPGLNRNLEGGRVPANLYEMSISMLVKGKVVRSTKLQEIVGINQEEIPGDLNTLLQTKAAPSTFETLRRKRSEMLRGEVYTCFSFS